MNPLAAIGPAARAALGARANPGHAAPSGIGAGDEDPGFAAALGDACATAKAPAAGEEMALSDLASASASTSTTAPGLDRPTPDPAAWPADWPLATNPTFPGPPLPDPVAAHIESVDESKLAASGAEAVPAEASAIATTRQPAWPPGTMPAIPAPAMPAPAMPAPAAAATRPELPANAAAVAVARQELLAAGPPGRGERVPGRATEKALPVAAPEVERGAGRNLTDESLRAELVTPGHWMATIDRLAPSAAAPAMPRPDSVAAVAPESTVAARESAAIAVPGLVLASPGLREAAATEHRAQAAPALPFEAHLSAALQSPDFAPALATQVSWLVQEGVQLARLTLNPAEMGPLAVHIVVDGSTARVDFSADLAATRSAIEAGLPSLAAALQDSGLTLSGGGVFDRQGRQGAEADARQGQPGGRATSNQDALAQGDATPGAALASRPTRGLVDLLA